MKNNLLSDYEILTRELKDKPVMSPQKRLPVWILKCECKSCKRFRKMIGGKGKKEKMRNEIINRTKSL